MIRDDKKGGPGPSRDSWSDVSVVVEGYFGLFKGFEEGERMEV